jgi:CheY-like chemotaxis protein
MRNHLRGDEGPQEGDGKGQHQPVGQTAPAHVRVLIVDDEPTITEALARVVEERGYVAVVAADGQEALEVARAQRPALVITDLVMPRLDGAGLLASLRTQAEADGQRPIPAIAMTGLRSKVPAGKAADAVLFKPFRVEDVLALLDRFLGPRAPRP